MAHVHAMPIAIAVWIDCCRWITHNMTIMEMFDCKTTILTDKLNKYVFVPNFVQTLTAYRAQMNLQIPYTKGPGILVPGSCLAKIWFVFQISRPVFHQNEVYFLVMNLIMQKLKRLMSDVYDTVREISKNYTPFLFQFKKI